MKAMRDVEISGKRVFLRVDFNVPLDGEGNITDDTRIRAHLPTIRYMSEHKGKLILASHLGRPKGKRADKYSLKPVIAKLSGLLGREVQFVDDCVGPEVEKAASALKEGDILLLQNLRFHGEEEKNDPAFSQELAKLCDVYVDDAFANAHRGHASNAGITRYVKDCTVGLLLESELSYLKKATDNPVRPLVAIIGGAKVSDKIAVLDRLTEKVDKLIIGGGMAFTFLKALGYEVGKSLCEQEMLDTAKSIMAKAKERKVKLYLPVDCIIAEAASADAVTKQVTVQEIPAEWMASISGLQRRRSSARPLPTGSPSYGTGLWACSSLAPSAGAPSASSTSLQIRTPSRSSVAETRTRPSIRRARRTGYRIYRPVEALSWSFWKASPCLRSRPSRLVEPRNETLDGRRQLEDA
jgi:phosphoglycerate kinase